MAQNLLLILPKMSSQLKLAIAFAVRNYSPGKGTALSHYGTYILAAKSMEMGFLDRKMVKESLRRDPTMGQSHVYQELEKLLKD